MAIINPDGNLSVSCSWCHELVAIRERRQFCPTCGHRADVARADCDCPKCWKPQDGVDHDCRDWNSGGACFICGRALTVSEQQADDPMFREPTP